MQTTKMQTPSTKTKRRERSRISSVETVRLRKTLAQHISSIRLFLLKHGWIVNDALKKSTEDVYDYWVMPQAMFQRLPKTKAPNVLAFASSACYDAKPSQTYNIFFQEKIINIFVTHLQLYTRSELEQAFLSPTKLEALLSKASAQTSK
jgi:hypothetical protein